MEGRVYEDVEDKVLLAAMNEWTKSPKRRSASDINFYSHCEVKVLISNIGYEVVSSNAHGAYKSRLPFKRSRVTFSDYEVENDMAMHDICVSVALKKAFIDMDLKRHVEGNEFYRWLRSYGRQPEDYKFVLRDYTISADYTFVTPQRILFRDKRSIVCANDIIYSALQMTSGHVPDAGRRPILLKKHTFGFPKPIVNLFSSTQDDELTILKSKNQYELRKVEPSIVDIIDSVSTQKLMRKINCTMEISVPSYLDLQMMHSDDCYGETNKHIRKCYHRLWFLNKVPTLKIEYDRLYAKWQRRSNDPSFFICKHCDDCYVIYNWKDVDEWDSSIGLARKMSSFCSYYCFNEFCLMKERKERFQEIRMSNMVRVFCPACEASCYMSVEEHANSDPMSRFLNSWRMLKVHDGHFSYERYVCSDDCQLYLRKKLSDKQSYIMARNNLVKAMVTANNDLIVRDTCPTISGTMFRFYTCFHCCKILHPGLGKICHFRNFPRLGWAYTCYNKECVLRFLHASLPVRLFEDSLFFASGDGSEAISLGIPSQKQMSSFNGRRFTLTIFE